MSHRQSSPSTTRKIISGLLIVVLLSIGLLLKIVRDFGFAPFLLPLDAEGTSPNLILPLAFPFGILLQNKKVSFLEFMKAALAGAVGLTLYEIIQIWMPWRTFDWYDIAASFAGAILAIILGWNLFFRAKN